VNRLVFQPGPALFLLGTMKLLLGIVFVAGLIYMFIKLGRLADAITESKKAATRST